MGRRHYRRSKFKFKLKQNTIYSLFGFGFLILGFMLLLSFARSRNIFVTMNNSLETYFGFLSFLVPFVFIFFAFLFFRLRMFLSRVNVAIGFLLLFLSIEAFARSGTVGEYLFKFLSDVLTDVGAYVVYLVGILIGLIVFFDTSIDQIVEFLLLIVNNIYRLFPKLYCPF